MVIAHRTTGLCNRIKNIVGAMMIDSDVRVCWKNGDGVLCEFYDLFENKIECNYLIEKHQYYGWRFVPKKYKLDFNYDKTHRWIVRMDIVDHLKRLVPVKYVREEVECYSELFDDDTVSVHVRSWGDGRPNQQGHWKEGMNGFDINNFIAEMRKHSGNFFIAYDNEKYFDILNKVFSGRLIRRARRECNPGGKEFTQDALIDLYLLAKNKVLIGTKKSTFTEVAWYLSGCQAKPVIL